jgi:hypothetical protein
MKNWNNFAMDFELLVPGFVIEFYIVGVFKNSRGGSNRWAQKNKITKRFSSKMFIDFITTYQKPVSCMLTL